jgi:ribonucleoside-diphosphate reductase alpha chain
MGDNVIGPSGHIAMMAAVQPFLSGAISKTVNLPEETTVEEVEKVYVDAWNMGLKAVALYRDNCKVGQPLTAKKADDDTDDPAPSPAVMAEAISAAAATPVREKLPRSRASRTFEFRVADCKGFVTVGEYADGRPGELFIRVSKQGSTLAGIMDAFAIAVSHGLQYGVPLTAFVDAFVGMRFEPAGMTDDEELRIASSLMDYLFRRMAVEYLPENERVARNILTTGERSQPTLPGVAEAATTTSQGLDLPPDPPSVPPAAAAPAEAAVSAAPFCGQCGTQMVRAGSCYACRDCGSTSGCS